MSTAVWAIVVGLASALIGAVGFLYLAFRYESEDRPRMVEDIGAMLLAVIGIGAVMSLVGVAIMAVG